LPLTFVNKVIIYVFVSIKENPLRKRRLDRTSPKLPI